MGDKYVATVRFHMEGVEAELYGRLMEGKKEAGLSEYLESRGEEIIRSRGKASLTEST